MVELVATPKRVFLNDNFYHVFNRGVERRHTFLDKSDYRRFLDLLSYYQFSGVGKYSTSDISKRDPLNVISPRVPDPEKKIIEIHCYCLMPNHFHLIIKQLVEGGITRFLSNIQNSYTRYFNIKRKRIGPLFQGPFKVVKIETDEQLVHLSRYIHLNPFVASFVEDPMDYKWSSCKDFLNNRKDLILNKGTILSFFGETSPYEKFVKDHADYARSLTRIKQLTTDH